MKLACNRLTATHVLFSAMAVFAMVCEKGSFRGLMAGAEEWLFADAEMLGYGQNLTMKSSV
jgi:hypothetical protein